MDDSHFRLCDITQTCLECINQITKFPTIYLNFAFILLILLLKKVGLDIFYSINIYHIHVEKS